MTNKIDKKKEDKEEKKVEDQRVKELEEKITSLDDQFKRVVADYRNLEKRREEEKREFVQFANRDLLLRILPAFDTLIVAQKYIEDEGLRLSIKKLIESLRDVGVEKIEVEGKDFDPNFMECIETIEGEENKVVQELTPGFTLYGKTLRPARVKVGKVSN